MLHYVSFPNVYLQIYGADQLRQMAIDQIANDCEDAEKYEFSASAHSSVAGLYIVKQAARS